MHSLVAITVVGATPVFSQEMSQIPPRNDAEYQANWGLDMIGALTANGLGFTGEGVIVAIVDSGLDVTHPEFTGRISDDLRNFGSALPPDDVSDIDAETREIVGHGTHVTGIIGAARDGTGLQGVAYDAILLPLRAVTDDPDEANLPDPETAAEGDAAADGAGVMNGSFGPPALPRRIPDPSNPNSAIDNLGYKQLDFQPLYESPDQLSTVYEELRQLAASNVVMIFAAGNEFGDQPVASSIPDGNGMLPLITPENTVAGLYGFVEIESEEQFLDGANYTPVDPTNPSVASLDFSDLKGSLIAVVAVGRDGTIASYSNRCGAAAEWCLAAPGGEVDGSNDSLIFSTFPLRTYEHDAGTSMAAPHVSGSAAVLRQAFPYMDARQVIETILTTTKDIGPEEILRPRPA